MSRRSDKDLIADMLEAINRAVSYCAELDYAAFLQDTKTQDAVVRNIEILGEAAKNVSANLRERHREIPWKSVAGMRNRLVHDYFGVNWDIVWGVLVRDLPALSDQLTRVLTDC